MKKIPDIINRLWNVCDQKEVGALLTCGSGIINFKKVSSLFLFLVQRVVAESSVFHRRTFCAKDNGQGRCFGFVFNHVIFAVLEPP